MPPRRTSKKDSPAKLAGRMKRRWRVVLLRSKGEILGKVEAPDAEAAKAAAAGAFSCGSSALNMTGWFTAPETMFVDATTVRLVDTIYSPKGV